MTSTREELVQELKIALIELEQWISGDMTFWNECHGSVTGDYENQVINTIQADNAQKIALAAAVTGLAALLNEEENK